MRSLSTIVAVACFAFLANIATAQTVTLKKRGLGTVTITKQGQTSLVTVKSTYTDAKALFQDIAAKSGARVLLSPAVSGPVSASVQAQPVGTAIRSVAAAAGLTVREIQVPQTSAGALTASVAGSLAGALSTNLTKATVVDPASGRAVVLSYASSAPTLAEGETTVYWVGRATAAELPSTGDAAQDAAASAATILDQLPVSQRMTAVRDLQRQMFENMTPEEREQMRQQMPGRGPGGPPPGGFGGQPPDGPPPGGMDGDMPPPPPM
jgi:hypothetical protein